MLKIYPIFPPATRRPRPNPPRRSEPAVVHLPARFRPHRRLAAHQRQGLGLHAALWPDGSRPGPAPAAPGPRLGVDGGDAGRNVPADREPLRGQQGGTLFAAPDRPDGGVVRGEAGRRVVRTEHGGTSAQVC